MKGRRLPLGEFPKEPGDYMGPIKGYSGDLEAIFFLKPNARDPDAPKLARPVHHVTCPPHTYRECPDGSLEIRASLGDMHTIGAAEGGTTQESDGWHGYLDEGHEWRKC